MTVHLRQKDAEGNQIPESDISVTPSEAVSLVAAGTHFVTGGDPEELAANGLVCDTLGTQPILTNPENVGVGCTVFEV